MCLFQVQHKLTSLYIPFTVLKDLSIVLWMCLSLQTVSFKEFSRIVYVFHCSVIKVLICLLSCDSLFTISLSKPFVNNFFSTFYFFKLFLLWFCGFLRQLIQNTTLFLQCQPENLTFFKYYSSFSSHLPFHIMTKNILHLLYSLPCTAPSINCHIDFFRYTCFHSFPRCVTLR